MQNKRKRLKILFLCNHNSCRSQMAEGWTRKLKGDVFEVYSAGFDDPPFLARTARTEEEALSHYRSVRDEIKMFVESLPNALLRQTVASR